MQPLYEEKMCTLSFIHSNKILKLGQTTYTGYFYCLLSAGLDKLICVWGFVSAFFFFSPEVD